MTEGITVCISATRAKPLIKGSTKEVCSRCKKQVWISPATRFSIEQKLYPSVIVCVNCAVDELDKETE